MATPQKRGVDISNAFASMSGQDINQKLPQRFADLKGRLIQGREAAVQASWDRLLLRLREEVAVIANSTSAVVPEIDFCDLQQPSQTFIEEHRKRGIAIIRNVVPTETALQYKAELLEYIQSNPQTVAYPPHDPQIYELYWSPSQMRARSHPNILTMQRFLMKFWHAPPSSRISIAHPITYADRLRIRQPGDRNFTLGPHVDGGSVERWEDGGYSLGHVYDKIFEGDWESYDPWEASGRVSAVSDLYNGSSACSMFRMYQGWLSMSNTGPGEGTLLVNPLLGLATAYYLLRPFFSPIDGNPQNLDPANWKLDKEPTSYIQGATPGHGQELSNLLHPHLQLEKTMIHIPRVNPGDYVAWHCDTVHAVDGVHAGSSDSSVMYIPVSPLTEHNAEYIERQRTAFENGTPAPDFAGGQGESTHVGRPTVEEVKGMGTEEAVRAFGLLKWQSEVEGLSDGQVAVMHRANEILGF